MAELFTIVENSCGMKPYLTLGEEIDTVQQYLDHEISECEGRLNREFLLKQCSHSAQLMPSSPGSMICLFCEMLSPISILFRAFHVS